MSSASTPRTNSSERLAVVAFNLGGPDTPKAIQPFLFNLFNDPAIIDLPGIARTPLAWLISTTRAPKVRPTYEEMGGASPIRKNTQAQADALASKLADTLKGCYEATDIKVFQSQRYWHPMAPEVARQVRDFNPTQIVLLPLYPQMSTTTTMSFHTVWQQAARKLKMDVPTTMVCCYPEDPGFVSAYAQLITPKLTEAKKYGKPRVLFSAHGLPQKTVDDRGDPYPTQVAKTAAAIARLLGEPDLDWRVTFQSRVGPLEWVKPYTDKEIEHAGVDRIPLVIVPLAFTCEHLETLVELDVEFKEIADEAGVPYYGRVQTVDTHPDFVDGLAATVEYALNKESAEILPPPQGIPCRSDEKACPCLQQSLQQGLQQAT